ncbi:MAG TPA: hypothetical protein DEA08_27770, partial [Planctomycetes bacterium]|nr:hypothetical protein [Planctomycetota bacterium]
MKPGARVARIGLLRWPQPLGSLLIALVRYGLLRHTAEFAPRGRDDLAPGGRCVVETPRGVELGVALAVLEREPAG